MAGTTAGGRVGRTIYMAPDSWNALARMNVPEAARMGDSAKLEAMVHLIPRLRQELATAQQEIDRLRRELRTVDDLAVQLPLAEEAVQSALSAVRDRLRLVRRMLVRALIAQG